MRKNHLFRRILSVVICLVMVMSYLPVGMPSAAATDQMLNIIPGSKKADPSTLDGWESYFGENKMDTEFAGAVWTDKSVFSANTDKLPGVSLTDDDHFLVALSAIASNLSITGHTSAPTDTMLVLDLSGSMVDDTYEVGAIRRGNNNYDTVEGIDMSLINAMIQATNDTIDTLMKQNTNNRVGVVLYSGNAASNEAATTGTATVVLPLGRYAGVDGEYLSVDTTYQTDVPLYEYVSSGWWGGSWQATGETATYVAEGTQVSVSVKNGLKTETGADVSDTSKRANGGTYIQNGLYQAMNQFLRVTDTTVPEGRPQAGTERMPVIVLMSDGAPTIATTSYNGVGSSDVGDGTATDDRITFLTQLTAAYVRGRVAAKYQENAYDEKDVLFLTLGLGTENSSAATNTLYPAGSNSTLVKYWDNYLPGRVNSNVQIVSGNKGWSVYRDGAVEAMNYVDKYFYANNAQGLIDSFNSIVSEISLKAESYATLVEGSSADFSGYVTFDDELGEMMQVYNIGGILLGDTLFTGRELAKGMNEGDLGTVSSPNARGDELVATVKERIPGTTTTQAQQLIGNAYNDLQLYYANDNNWSNYIGWYADADGNYVGFWDKDSGYENAPAGAVYANKSYGYLGVNGDSDMMHVVVMVRTELATLHQTVVFKIPAALLPTVQYKITLDEDDPSAVEEFIREDAKPMRLVFEAGLREDINSVNLEQKIAEHIAKGGHVHRNTDGTVTFYTNEWKIGNDTNGNGIPDPEEVDNAVVTQSHFHPALDNSRFYYTEDTLILTGSGNTVTGSTRPTDTDNDAANGTGYYYDRYIYGETGRTVIHTPIAATTLANDAVYDTQGGYWYIPAGTMYHNLARFQTNKTSNTTNTLAYSFFPAVFDSVSKQDVYTFLGNNGSVTVAPATGIVLNKQIQGTIADVSQYTFRVTLSNIPNGTVVTPVLTDANGDTLTGVTMSPMANNQFTVTMPANVDAYISGIPVGVNVTVEELISGDYKVVDIRVAGAQQDVTQPAALTVPAYSATGSQMVSVTFTNAPNYYGDLVIEKEVHHELASDPEALATKIFTFQVELTGSNIKTGDTFDTSAGTKVTVAGDGTLSFVGGAPITLHNDESVTILRIPEGTTYTVTEINIPDGFALDGSSGTTGQILANGVSTAGFVNAYPDNYDQVELDLNVTVNKILNGDPADVETFTFALQQLLSDNTYPDVKTFTVRSDAANKVATDTLQLTFDKLGTYYYRIVEKTPADPTPGMTYSTTRALFAVLVTDDDMDGKLEIAVREEANIDASVTYTDAQDHETATDISVEAEFTNTYEVHSTNVAVNIHKDLTNDTGVEIPLTGFRFGLYAVDASGNATGDPIQTVTASALGDATFNLIITEDRDLTYIIKEIVPNPGRVGMTYDPSEYVLSIAVTADPAGQLSAVPSIRLKGHESEGEKAPVFTNVYELTPASARITLSKTLVGRALKEGETFRFDLVRTDDTYKPLTGADAYNASYYLGSGSVTILLDYDNNAQKYLLDKAGTYHYLLTEAAGTAPGMTYDPARYHISITVSDNGNGALVASAPVIRKLGEATPVTSAAFVNTYTVTGSEDVTIGGKKVLNGRAMVAGEFTMGLYSDAACTDLIETAVNLADGTFSFSPITYTSADLGENNAAKTYTYYVKEIAGSKGGVTYDPNVYTVTVVVSHEDGVLKVTSDGASTLQITNSYQAQPVNVTLSGSKALSGDWAKVPNKDFTFQLFKANASFVITDQTPVKTATVTGEDDFTMTLTYEDGQEGYYYYVLKENIPAERAGGVGYDAGEYHITVNVSDPGDGQLVAMTTIYRPGTGNTATAVFTNVYTVEPTTLTLEGSKSFINTTNDLPMVMEGGEFGFLVLEGEALVTTGTNRADGTIEFRPIRYTAAGVHTYTVVETEGTAGGVTYSNALFTVKVTVTDNGNGTLTAVADYNGTPVAFENTYTPDSAQVTLSGKKAYAGDWSAVASKVFNFQLFETGSTFAATGEPKAVAVNEEDGTFTFGTITYTAAGTHYYVIREEHFGETINGITYDSKQIQVTVVVTDNGSGKLIPAVTVSDTAATVVTADHTATVDNMVFTNAYSASPATYIPAAKKQYEGDEMKEFDFVLSVDGVQKQTKQNDEEGNVLFDELSFETPGIYKITVREQKNILWGLIRWDTNVYTITLHVEDNGLGRLVINESKTTVESENDRLDLVFRNAHHDVITDKDVFLVSDPAVSIDGKAVEVGEELLYKISYTNFAGKKVNITITDTIPEHTEYVAGSADNGGVLEDGVLTWQIADVPADETVTVSFRVKVTDANETVTNSAVVLEGENTYNTKEVSTSTKEDTVVKNVSTVDEPTVSIDGKAVEKGDILLYKITYTNRDDFAADVTVTDTIPEHTEYVAGSADNGGTLSGNVLTWNLQLGAGENKTVSFQVKVTGAAGATVTNKAAALEGNNRIDTNQVTNPVKEDVLVKNAYNASAPTVSIDGKEVKKGEVLVYTITYTNRDDFAADVTITDVIPQYTEYVAGSADNGGTLKDGTLTWSLQLAAGESKTVSFKVKIVGESTTISNTAEGKEGENTLKTNSVTTKVPPTVENPKTADTFPVQLLGILMLTGAAGIAVLLLNKKRIFG